MNNDIKEILELYKDKDIEYYNLCSDLGYDKLLNYITNLQEEIKSANESVTWWTNRYEAVVRNCDETVKKMMALGEENQRLKEIVENLTTMTVCGDRKQIKNTAQFKLEQCQSRIDKALDKLYCYGEVFDSKILQQFQKEMLDILQGE